MKFLVFKIVLTLTSVLSLRTIHILGRFIGWLAWVANARIRRIAEKNIALCFPELDSQEQSNLVKNTLKETGKTILETGKMWQGYIDSTLSLIKRCENQHIIDDALKNNQVKIQFDNSTYLGRASNVEDENLAQKISELKYPGEERAKEKRVVLEISLN